MKKYEKLFQCYRQNSFLSTVQPSVIVEKVMKIRKHYISKCNIHVKKKQRTAKPDLALALIKTIPTGSLCQNDAKLTLVTYGAHFRKNATFLDGSHLQYLGTPYACQRKKHLEHFMHVEC